MNTIGLTITTTTNVIGTRREFHMKEKIKWVKIIIIVSTTPNFLWRVKGQMLELDLAKTSG